MKAAHFLLSAITLALLAAPQAQACDFCLLGQGVSPYITANGNGLMLGSSYTQMDQIYDHTHRVETNGKKEAWWTQTLTAFHSYSEDFTVLTTLPFSIKTNIDYDETANLNPGTLTSGIGDVTVTGRYTVLRKSTLESALIGGFLAGIKLPTGSTNLRDQQGNPVDRHALPGTGSWDFDLGFSGSLAYSSGLQFTLDAAYRISTTGKWAERDHRFGNTFNYAAKAFYRVAQGSDGAAILPFLGISGQTTGTETGTEDPATSTYSTTLTNPSTGGTVLFVDLGFYANLSPNTLLTLGVGKSFYRNMNYQSAYDADPAENTKLDFALVYRL